MDVFVSRRKKRLKSPLVSQVRFDFFTGQVRQNAIVSHDLGDFTLESTTDFVQRGYTRYASTGYLFDAVRRKIA